MLVSTHAMDSYSMKILVTTEKIRQSRIWLGRRQNKRRKKNFFLQVGKGKNGGKHLCGPMQENREGYDLNLRT